MVWIASTAVRPARAASATAAPIGAYTTKGAWNFLTAPNVHPPKLSTTTPTASSRLAHGDFLLDNFPNVGAPGPMTGQGGPVIFNSKLQPVWFRSVGTGLVSGDLQQESYLGKPVLLWWQGLITKTGTTLSGEDVIVNQQYRTVATLRARAPWVISVHDAVISGPNIWVTVYRLVRNQNLRAYGGSAKGAVLDAGVQEYSVATGKLLYTWDALNPGGKPNLPLADSEQSADAAGATGGAWDAYHVNSVEPLPGNQVLVSMRNTWAAYLINTQTGAIVWTLGGKHSSFSFGPGASFAWQHDVELSGDRVTMFNDNCCKQLPSGLLVDAKPAGGLVLRLDTAKRTASHVATYSHSPTRYVPFLGSMELLPGGNALVGWGSSPFFSEYSSSGKLLLDAEFPHKDQSYRAQFTNSWVGTPAYPPGGAVRHAGGKTTVYASWNGATQVAAWQVLAGSNADDLKPVATATASGFETAITVHGSYNTYEVRALNGRHQTLGTSLVFPKRKPSSSVPGSY